MGNEVTGKSGQPVLPPVRSNDPAPTGGNRPERSSGDSRTRTPATGNPRSGAAGAAGGNPEKEKKVQPELVAVNAAVPEPPKKKQQRKPRKQKKDESSFNAEQISALILSASAIVASKPEMSVWALQPEEANQLATPIANMIQKSEALQKLGEYSDAVALVTASLVIFAPRAMVYHDQQKKKKEAQGVIKRVDKRKSETGSNKPNERNEQRTAPAGANDASSIFNAIPATI